MSAAPRSSVREGVDRLRVSRLRFPDEIDDHFVRVLCVPFARDRPSRYRVVSRAVSASASRSLFLCASRRRRFGIASRNMERMARQGSNLRPWAVSQAGRNLLHGVQPNAIRPGEVATSERRRCGSTDFTFVVY
jgi:hypothetical protein